jgi:DNA-binding beta-propeller fold protein YncE
VIRTSDNTVIDTINVGNGPIGIPITPDGNFIYVPIYTDATVYVIRTLDNSVIDTVDVVNPQSYGKFIVDAATVPSAPSNLNATPSSKSQINLFWSDNSVDETGFKIERKTGSGGIYAQIWTTSANVTSYSDTGLKYSTTYYYRIRAYNEAGNSSYSNESSATTYDLSPPLAPSDLTATAVSSSQIDLSWSDNSLNETGFVIERHFWFLGFEEIATVGANVTSYSDTGLSPSTYHDYRVYAFNDDGNSPTSNEDGDRTFDDLTTEADGG